MSTPSKKRVPAIVQPHSGIASSAPQALAQLSSPKKGGFKYEESPRFASPASDKAGKVYSSYSPWHASESRAISSTVITNPQDWCDEGLLIPHESLRLDLARATAALDAVRPDDAAAARWKLDNFYTWYREYHYPNVHHHHDAEEHIYFPWIETRVTLPPKLAADHAALLARMATIDGLYEAGAADALDGAALAAIVTALQREWREYRELMEPHLAEEEAAIPGLLRANFTIEEEAEVVNKIIESLGLTGNKTFLPLILDAMRSWGGERKVAEFKQNIPPPILFLLDYFWQPDYENRQRALLESLKLDEDPFAPDAANAGPTCGVFW